MILLNNVSSDTTSNVFESLGGRAVVNVRGDNYGGGTVTIEMASVDDPNVSPRFIALPDGTVTADASVRLDYLPVGVLIRVSLSGSAGASNVFADILQ